ncbi:GNAT family N-acetyltransferase [Gimesia sp.]|uniref:GNAT family N-acetyltransferase n=1 Tax=Gimesia sp. TaxID=2024833 RepID=UPI0032EC8639
MALTLQPLDHPDQLDLLAEEARSQGYRMLDRLQQEWREGTNCFDREGECVLIAVRSDRIVGVCGLNRDPYCARDDVGRVRRLYVSVEFRRQDIGRQLVETIQQHCQEKFSQFRLRTHSPEADAFYLSLGFRHTTEDPCCTHVREVQPVLERPIVDGT